MKYTVSVPKEREASTSVSIILYSHTKENYIYVSINMYVKHILARYMNLTTQNNIVFVM